MDNKKPTWDYILNDMAFNSLLTKCLYSEYPNSQDKYDLEYQIKLIQNNANEEIVKLKNKIKELEYVEKYYIEKVKEQEKNYHELYTENLINIYKINRIYELLEKNGINKNYNGNEIYKILEEEKEDINFDEDFYYLFHYDYAKDNVEEINEQTK